MTATDSLRRIEHWLAAHAPQILHDSLRDGAPASALARLAQTVGQPLPADYQALYRWRDGLDEDADNFGSLCYGLSFLPLAEVAAAYQHRRQNPSATALTHVQAPVQAANQPNPAWLPLGFDGAHAWLYVDLAPAAAGSYGQVIFVDEEYQAAFRVAESVGALLAEFADDLEQGRYFLAPDALEDGNQYLAAVDSIDVVNWQRAARWQHALPSSTITNRC